MEKYQFDENLINEGWSQMNVVLDQEMPVEKKKRRAFIFWFSAVSGIAATVFLSWLALSYLSVSSENENKIVQNTVTEPVNSPRVLNPWRVGETEIADKTTSTNAPKVSNPWRVSETKTNIQDLDLQHLAPFYDDNVVFSSEIKSDNNTDVPNEINAVRVQNPDSVQEIKRKNTAISLIENRKKLTEIPHQNEEKTLDLERLKTDNKSKKNYQIGVFVGANVSLSTLGAIPNNGVILGLKYAKKVKKHLFEAGLFWENTSKKSAIYYVQTNGKNTSKLDIVYPFAGNMEIDSLLKSSGNIPTGKLNTNDLIKGNRFLTTLKMNQIGVSVAYAYRFTKRWEVTIGLAATRSFGQTRYATLLNSWPLQKNYNDANPFVPQDFSTNVLTNFDETNAQDSFINYDVYYNFGISYYFTKSLKTSVLYRSGLVDLTKSNVITKKEINDFYGLQLTKYF